MIWIWWAGGIRNYLTKSDPDLETYPKLSERSDPDTDSNKVISDPQHGYGHGIVGTYGK